MMNTELKHLEHNLPGNGIVVTIDDGPIDEHCDDFLKACAENDLKTYCFVVGKQLEAHPDLARKLLDHGHVLCNHTYSHPPPPLTQLSPEMQAEELDRCTEQINLPDRPPHGFVPPIWTVMHP